MRAISLLLILTACEGVAPVGDSEEALASRYITRDPIGSNVRQFEPIDDNRAYFVDSLQNLYYWENGSARVVQSGVAWVGATGDPTQVWLKDTSNQLYFWGLGETLPFKNIYAYNVADAKAVSSVVYFRKQGMGTNLYRAWSANGQVAQVASDAASYYPIDLLDYYLETADRSLYWVQPTYKAYLDGNVLFAQEAAQLAYVLGTDRKLWREKPTQGHGPNPIDTSVSQFYAVDSAMVFVKGTDNNLWREDGDWTHRDHVDGNVSAFRPTSLYTVWVMGLDGNLWREHLSTQLP